MAPHLNVLFLSSEVDPFAKTGGLADVAGALPAALHGLGVDVRVLLPFYGEIHGREAFTDVPHAVEFTVPLGPGRGVRAGLKQALLPPGGAVPVYALAQDSLYARRGLYVDHATGKDFPDNHDRFITFCRGALEGIARTGWRPDVIHCNDWPAGLVPAYLRTLYASDPRFRGTRSVFTIHNMAYQGVFPASVFAATELPPEAGTDAGITAFGSLNFLKAGLVYADALTTVSRKYAEEIQSGDEFGCGLQDVARTRAANLHGILNGADYGVWDPSADRLIPHRFTATDTAGKELNKRELLRSMGLPFSAAVPVVGMISRLADQKGFDLLHEALPELMRLPLQLVILGTGEKKYHEMLEEAHRRHPDRIAVRLAFDNRLAHLIEAGSDMFLMPSRYEPCGLNQIYSLRYGTVPVVRATGGLDDTIIDVSAYPGRGTGFKFSERTGTALLHALRRALPLFADRAAWSALMHRGMTADFSWAASARQYADLYRSLVPA